ncbi:hypothetical protein EXU48_09010 [Occultella glacieicola]|uniref:Uncharacterized protein n=1 Tax=Occultella glacieicola TaxID=2518684 RepID=A0ABY2E5M3_9MICO|nr:hypothetical protein [Occultella glacieicola]TDE94914.1 hypothetical protein EXU48_09010 [Occultella glacieicola]
MLLQELEHRRPDPVRIVHRSGVPTSGQLYEVGVGDRFGYVAGALGEGVGIEREGHEEPGHAAPVEAPRRSSRRDAAC